MISTPPKFKPLLHELSSSFSRSQTAERVILFFTTAILITGNKTVSSVVRLLSIMQPVNPSTYHRLFSHRKWCMKRLAFIITRFVLDRFVSEGIVKICGDETVDGHRGKNVYGKARHRDAVRSSHSHTVYRYGHKWIVLSILVELPKTSRPFALPILVALYRDRKTNTAEGRRHKTPRELMCGLIAILLHWFPERKFMFAGDCAYGTHAMARFAYRHQNRLTLVSKIVPDANLFAPPSKQRNNKVGRPATKGKSLLAPCDVVTKRKRRKKLLVRWYGGGWRNVEIVTGHGCWYRAGQGIVPILWVYVKDLDGTHRDEYFFTTDVSLPAEDVIEMYGGRWNIETTFQEMREHLGLETTRGWSKQTVLRMAPCLFCLYTLIVLFYDSIPKASPHLQQKLWLGKEAITFSDMIASVRRYLWQEWIFAQVPGGGAVQKLPVRIRKLLHFGLTQAA